MSEWKETTLGDVSVDVAYGYTESASGEKVGPRFLRITDIQNGVVDWHTVPYCPISESNHEKYRLRSGDIVVARTGNSTGENYLYQGDEDAVYASYLIRFRVNQQIADPAFVWYSMRTQRWWDFISSSKTGSAQAGANAKVLGLFPLTLPPLPEQKAIAAVLGALDDKIELNRRMNATLEAMARTLFQSWFVDFDPVRSKLDGRQSTNLAPATAALFPDSFQDSELGPIPKGWAVNTIKNTALNIQYGFTQSATKESIGPHFLRITDIRGGTIDWSSVPFCETSAEEREKYRIKDGDIFIARTGASTGDNIYVIDPPFAVFASYLIRVQFNSPGFARLVGEYARTSDYSSYVAGVIGGSAQPNASAQTLAAASLVFPTDGVAEAFYRLVRPLDLKRVENDRESHALATLRDTLIPKLLSGKLSVASLKFELS